MQELQHPTFVALCSGRGSNLSSIFGAISAKKLKARPLAIISSNKTAPCLQVATTHNLEPIPLSSNDRDLELTQHILRLKPDFIILAGYIKLIPKSIIKSYEGRILNIHPSLLPDFGGPGMYGLKVHQAVLDAGSEISGASVHLVTEKYDEGEILLQGTVPVKPNDTAEELAERVFSLELELYPKAIELYLQRASKTRSNN